MTMLARRHSPMAELLERFERFDREFPFWSHAPVAEPYVNVEDYVDDGTYVLRVELPGVDPDKDISLTLQGDLLTISGERREETKDKMHREFHYGAFCRTLTLPEGAKAEDVAATYTHGVLEVRVPLAVEEKVESTRIPITH